MNRDHNISDWFIEMCFLLLLPTINGLDKKIIDTDELDLYCATVKKLHRRVKTTYQWKNYNFSNVKHHSQMFELGKNVQAE